MIDLSKSDSWHLQVLQLFNGWHDDAIRLSYLERLTTCSYFGLVFKSIAALVMLSAACFTIASSITIHVVLTGMLYTGDLIATSNMAKALLVEHFRGQFGIVGAVYGLLGGFSLFLTFGIAATFAMLIFIFSLDHLLSKIKQKDFGRVTLKKRFVSSSTYKILHSIFNKYCVPVKLHND